MVISAVFFGDIYILTYHGKMNDLLIFQFFCVFIVVYGSFIVSNVYGYETEYSLSKMVLQRDIYWYIEI